LISFFTLFTTSKSQTVRDHHAQLAVVKLALWPIFWCTWGEKFISTCVPTCPCNF